MATKMLNSFDVRSETSIIGRSAVLLGCDENALRIIVSLLLGYPLALCYRWFLYGRSPTLQHIFFTVCGIWLCYFNFGLHVVHSIVNILLIYLILMFSARTMLSVALAFTLNMTYLLIGYYVTMSDTYTIKWTTPHCVITLRLIGLVWDVYDGKTKQDKLSEEQKETALVHIPSLLEICGHTYFFGGFLVGPQFPMKRYQNLVSGVYSHGTDGQNPNSLRPALLRLVAGCIYTAVFQITAVYVPDTLLSSAYFNERMLITKCLLVAIWGKLTLYKYVACWLMAEGACIMTGLTYNGKDKNGVELWDSCANIKIRQYERASTCHELIQAFNINTNRWMAKYVFKRLRFLGNKSLSQLVTMFVLALWHGLYSGYFMNFAFEFFIVQFEKQASPVFSSFGPVKMLYSIPGGSFIIWSVKKFYAQFVLGYALIGFCLFTFDRYSKVYSSMYWIGHILFVLVWPLLYFLLSRMSRGSQPKSSKNDEDSHKKAD